MSESSGNILYYKPRNTSVLTLVLSKKNSVNIGDKPIFGSSVTLSENLYSIIGQVISAGMVIGWVNYIELNQFACITDQQHYVAASDYLYTDQNQLIVSKPIKLHMLGENMKQSRALFAFSEA